MSNVKPWPVDVGTTRGTSTDDAALDSAEGCAGDDHREPLRPIDRALIVAVVLASVLCWALLARILWGGV